MNVWKVGTRWGNQGRSVFDLFLDYGIVFVGGTNDGKRQGDYHAVQKGDLFLIVEGATPIAIGKAKSGFLPWDESGVSLRACDRDEFFYEDTVICKTEIKVLDKPQSWSFGSQIRFCRNGASYNEVKNYWEKMIKADDQGGFDIQSRTVSLFSDGNADDSIFNAKIRYRIPIYQRPYSWGSREIDRLFQDVVKGIKDSDVLFMGTMQVSAPFPLDLKGHIYRYDVIDGQQRITTFLLLACILTKMEHLSSSALQVDSVLRTLVNKGEAQKDLDDFLQAGLDKIQASESSSNIYLRNAFYILSKLNELFGEEAEFPSFIELSDFLQKNVRIVVIETRAGISKTIQIFNVINTTGLDLNGSDIFKVRFFEFLTDKCGQDQDVFDEISGLYGEIEQRNKANGSPITNMQEILTILQALIIAKYDLNVVLFDYGTDRFFEQLFDLLLGINKWDHFDGSKLAMLEEDGSPLSIEEIQKLIHCRYEFHNRFGKDDCRLKDVILTRLMGQSRYGWRYWYYPVIFMYQQGHEGLFDYYEELVRLCLCYSLIKSKVVYEAHACVRSSLKALFLHDTSSPEILKTRKNELQEATHTALYENELAYNAKWKLIVCRLSEYLDCRDLFENSHPEIIKNIFHERIDVEHIQAANDRDGKRRDAIISAWGPILNGIGNLVMLEYDINRSISNKPFSDKKAGYHASCYKTVKSLLLHDNWELKDCEARRDLETDKLMHWLFR